MTLRWAEHVAVMGGTKMDSSFWLRNLVKERLIGKPRRRWEDNITMNLRKYVVQIEGEMGSGSC
jgi:hypothetical protein